MSESTLRTDILPEELTTEQRRVIIQHYLSFKESAIGSSVGDAERLRTPQPARNINEFYWLVQNAIEDYERREGVIDEGKVFFTEEDIDLVKDKNVIITFGLERRLPGSFGRGAPFEADVTNQRPVFREEIEDLENPGYKRAILGYWHDNDIKFTIFSRTNKMANDKALWFENIMTEYSWYFTSQGVARVMFLKRDSDFVIDVNGSKMYGRPIHFFVRTETLRTISEKVIEQICIQAEISNGI